MWRTCIPSPASRAGGETLVGPGKPIDTDRYFVIGTNVVGGCMGSTGPSSLNPATGAPYGLDLPILTIRDMVRAQAMLVDHLGIERLLAVVGGSMGGMQVLQWAASYPERVFAAFPIATAARHSAQNIAFHEVGRQAIMADPEWRAGRYLADASSPRRGLAVARMAAHITYMSDSVRCTGSSAGGCRTARGGPSPSTRISRWSPICATRARPSSTASTPIPIST